MRSECRNRTYLGAALVKDYLYIKDFAKLLQRNKGRTRFIFGNSFQATFWGWLNIRRDVRIFPFLAHTERHKIAVMWLNSFSLWHADPLGHRHKFFFLKKKGRRKISRRVLGIPAGPCTDQKWGKQELQIKKACTLWNHTLITSFSWEHISVLLTNWRDSNQLSICKALLLQQSPTVLH